ncbi:ATP-grasp domain-containing protein, partial [Polaribacter sp.]|nr:ATP-grasp domain-containing protein [Polaribacter sp.]
NIIAAAEITNADAIHPGYGFLSENAKFSNLCEEHHIKFIGATGAMIDQMGDKANAKSTMKAAGVPCVPGSEGTIADFAECKKLATETGYPVMLKASAGGGGKGMRAVWKSEDLKEAWDAARQESKAAFGNDDMYMEKLIEEPRHIEIQIIGDSYGKACHLSERDCSVQRRHQKLTEETPSPYMTDELREKMGDAAVKAAEFIKYEGAGTVEFLVDKHRNFYFMEMNTRIQVEHPITEEVVNYDLIREQILVAAGTPISGKNHYPKMHSIECRINAEDPYNNFRPSPGKITTLHAPGGHGVRIDTHVYAGYMIPSNYDSMIAKLITTAQTREEAISKMKRALDEFVIEGVKTTIPFHRQLMDDPAYVAGDYTTKFMEDFEMK